MNNKVALVTGVSRLKGIGRAICLELAKQGCDIFFTYWISYDQKTPWGIEKEEPEQIQQELIDCRVRCKKMELDLSTSNSVPLLFETVNQELGAVSILVK